VTIWVFVVCFVFMVGFVCLLWFFWHRILLWSWPWIWDLLPQPTICWDCSMHHHAWYDHLLIGWFDFEKIALCHLWSLLNFIFFAFIPFPFST
jgi:hypothetical protein